MTQPYAAPPVPQPHQKRRKWPWIVGGIVVLLFVIVGVSNGGNRPGSPVQQPTGVPAGNEAPTAQQPQQPAKPAQHTVVYRVAGTARTASNVTYTTDGMTSSNQESSVKLPWSKTITLPTGQALQMVSILAQGGGSGTIEVTIEVDGKVFKQASADGYGVATANGNIGSLGN
jgi:hypothetical protein